MQEDTARRGCGCPHYASHTCGSGERRAVRINLADPRWQQIAYERLGDAMYAVPSDLRTGYVTVMFQWEARPGVWPD